MLAFNFKHGGLEAKIDEYSVWGAVSSLEGKFTATAVLKKIYETQGVSDEYKKKYADRDAIKVNNILNSLWKKGLLNKWDVYYEKNSNIIGCNNRYACAAP